MPDLSFSSRVKEEIFKKSGGTRHCRIAEITAIINGAGGFDAALRKDGPAARKLKELANGFKANKEELLRICGLEDGRRRIDGLTVKNECCKMAYLRGVFLAGGTVTSPQKSYHMEFVVNDDIYCDELMELFRFFGFNPKRLTKNDTSHVVYFKKSDEIGSILALMGAHVCMMELELCAVDRDVNNAINRANNWIVANENKAITASANQIKDINRIQQHIGLAALSKPLYDVAIIRLENQLDSLQDIGAKLNPPISKSGVNHRLRKISEIARGLTREEDRYD